MVWKKGHLAQRYRIFLFPWKSLRVTHSLVFRKSLVKKKQAGKKTGVPFFFPRKSLNALTHSKSEAGKKTASEKKTQHFYSLTRILPKMGQKQTFPGK